MTKHHRFMLRLRLDQIDAFDAAIAKIDREVEGLPYVFRTAPLYEQEKVKHVGAFPQLEDQLCAMWPDGYAGAGSPDRLDTLVWNRGTGRSTAPTVLDSSLCILSGSLKKTRRIVSLVPAGR